MHQINNIIIFVLTTIFLYGNKSFSAFATRDKYWKSFVSVASTNAVNYDQILMNYLMHNTILRLQICNIKLKRC